MSKRNRRQKGGGGAVRDAPEKRGIVLQCGADMWHQLCCDGYKPLMACPEVQICINVYADLVASMPIHLMQNTEKGEKRIKNGLSRRLDIEPNRYMVRQTFIRNLVRVMLSTGNQITVPVYGPDGMLTELVPLPPSRVSLMQEGGGYVVRYGDMVLYPDEVLHFIDNSDPEQPWRGMGREADLRDVVKSIRQTAATKQALSENPAPSLIVKVDAFRDELRTVEGRREIADRYLSDMQAGRPLLVQAEMFDVQQVTPLSIVDLAIPQTMELDKKSVAAIFGVPAFLVGVGEFKADEYDWFVNTRVKALAQAIEQELTRKLLYSPDLYFRFNQRSLLNYDTTKVVAVVREMVDRIAMDRNEARDWLGMDYREDMEELLALENYIPATMLKDQKKLTGGGENE